MRIGIASDLHIERERALLPGLDQLVGTDAAAAHRAKIDVRRQMEHPALGPDLMHLVGKLDLCILAGDIGKGTTAVSYAAEASRYLACPVVLVPGNHEFYGGELTTTLAAMRAAAESAAGVTLLDGDRLDLSIDGQRVAVLGCTLWTDYAVNGYPQGYDSDMERARRLLNDHRLIRLGSQLFQPEDALTLHQTARAWLANEIPRAKATADRVVVVTHHAPAMKCTAPQHRHSALSAAFVSDLTTEIKSWAPDVWVYGHTHYSKMLRIGRTWVVGAQRGYLWGEVGADTFTPRIIRL